MEKKLLNCLGMMSGTSMDGVDISLIKTDGENFFESIIDKYYEFPDNSVSYTHLTLPTKRIV